MTRQYKTAHSAPSGQVEKYKTALEKLQILQAECESPENRYYCPCLTLADGEEALTGMQEMFRRYKALIYENGPDKPPTPIDPASVSANEILFRWMMHEDLDETLFGSSETNEPTDGYRRWNPPPLSKGNPNYTKLTQRINREISRLEARKKKGHGYDAKPCEVCIVKTPENKIPRWGLEGVTAYMCEVARAQTPEQIEESNANAIGDLWKLAPKQTRPSLYPRTYQQSPGDEP